MTECFRNRIETNRKMRRSNCKIQVSRLVVSVFPVPSSNPLTEYRERMCGEDTGGMREMRELCGDDAGIRKGCEENAGRIRRGFGKYGGR